MSQQLVRCSNCGTTWFHEAALAVGADSTVSSAVCPTCSLAVPVEASGPARIESVTDLERQLDVLVRSALESGLAHAAVMHVLRDELTFAAELEHAGHRFTIQLIDLGLQDNELQQRPFRDRRDSAANRRGTSR